MGGGGSKPPPTITEDSYPATRALTNLSLAPGTTEACNNCSLGIDARASTSSVKLVRDFGNISSEECGRYAKDRDATWANEMSFHDFFTNLQAGNYSMPHSETPNGMFCRQVIFPEEVAAKITKYQDFVDNFSQLKTIRIRKVTGGGSFSSGTKAKFRLSIPIKAVYADSVKQGTTGTSRLEQVNGIWSWISRPGETTLVPEYKSADISSLSMYHPSPVRIENVQHDAVLSLNDPSDESVNVVILIPLKASNTGDESVDFFGKIAKHLTTISTPDSVTGLYPETDIPTGNDWNIKSVFWLGKTGPDNISPVTDAFYTWLGAASFKRVKLWENSKEIRYGWQPDGRRVRYIMLQTPVSISTTDLSFLTRSLPPTPPELAIHGAPDATLSASAQKVLYRPASDPAASADCGKTIERMTNPGPGDIIASAFSGGNVQDLLVDEKGQPLSDKESCDPFANNVKKLTQTPTPFTPQKAFRYFFNVLIVIAVAFGVWLGLFFVVNKDYDSSYKSFSEDAGKVVASFALQASRNLQEAKTGLGDSFSGLASLAKRGPSDTGEGPGIPKGLGKIAGLFGKKA